MNPFRRTVSYFDRLENRLRGWFARHPVIYGFVGGVGIVLFWRGVWVAADVVMQYAVTSHAAGPTLFDSGSFVDAMITIIVSVIVLLATGLFVPSFIGAEVILSGLKGEKTVAEKTSEEVVQEEAEVEAVEKEERAERKMIREIRDELQLVEHDLAALRQEQETKEPVEQ